MKIFTCTGPVDIDMDVVETDPHMCDNCKGKVINAIQERMEESRPFIIKHRDKKNPSEEIDDVSFRLLVLS
jgi:hypothetical protein